MTETNTRRNRIFISYKRNVEPDEPVVLQVFEALRQHHDVFIDQTILVGEKWAERIEAELRRSDFLISFLSANSIHSEMVLGEIETAHHLAKEQGGRPAILPVRLAYSEPFQYPLSAYLNPINWALWQSHEDTSRIIEELIQAISGGALTIDEQSKADLIQISEPQPIPVPLASAQPVRLEAPEGTMDPQSDFYIERPGDQIALGAIERQGVTITIKGPRQMGKSSLLIRTIDAAAKADKRVVFLDFQLFDKSTLADADTFFRQFCASLTDELKMDNRVDGYWETGLSNSYCCTHYVGDYLLKELGNPLVLAIDEAESVFDTDFRTDFFGMLRSWHNSRSREPIWQQLDLALVTSTEPYQLIDDLNQSPFNVGEVIDLEDFTPEQVAELNRRHGSPLTPEQERQLMTLLGGHPYLVRRALYLVASQRISTAELFDHATDDRGPFGDHLRYHLFRLHGKDELIKGLRQVIRNNICQDDMVFFRLRGAGLVRRGEGADLSRRSLWSRFTSLTRRRKGRIVLPRCQLYADYFQENLHG